MKALENKFALVTGGSHGIGRAIALSFAEAGADVVLTYRGKEAGAKDVAAQIEAMGRKAHVFHAELSNQDDCARVANQAIEVAGQLDILVNNAGGGVAGDLLSMPFDTWKYALDLNLVAPFLISQNVARHMVEHGKGGSVINISSVHSKNVWANRAPYGVAKAALNRLTMSMGLEWAQYGIRANAIAPGYINTSETEEEKARYNAGDNMSAPLIVAQRTAAPSEIGSVAVFLASDAASYITGQTIFADGGVLLPSITTADFMRGDRKGDGHVG